MGLFNKIFGVTRTAETTTIQATWNGRIVAESEKTVRVEGNHYFPAEAVKPEFLKPSAHHTVCGWKGTASYFDLVVDGEVNLDAAWTYRDPKPQAADIRDHIAFWHGVRVKRI